MLMRRVRNARSSGNTHVSERAEEPDRNESGQLRSERNVEGRVAAGRSEAHAGFLPRSPLGNRNTIAMTAA